jgi:N-acylneuraminate cytidylyltransferase
MTDNRVWVTEQGEEAVACSRGDGMGLQLLRRLGVDAFVLSTERNPVVGRRCEKLGLPFEQGVADKGRRLREIIAERGLDAARVVYVGNDVNDLECLAIAGCGVAVADSHPDVLRVADLVLTRSGGFGAVRELCDRIAAMRRGR